MRPTLPDEEPRLAPVQAERAAAKARGHGIVYGNRPVRTRGHRSSLLPSPLTPIPYSLPMKPALGIGQLEQAFFDLLAIFAREHPLGHEPFY